MGQLDVRHVEAIRSANDDAKPETEATQKARNSRKTGKFKKVCPTDPDATMATIGRNRHLELSYKQYGVIDDVFCVLLEVAVKTGETNKGEELLARLDAVEKATGVKTDTVTADAGYAYTEIYGGLECREVAAIIPAKAEPIRSPVPMRRFRYDAKHDILKFPRGKNLKAGPSSTGVASLLHLAVDVGDKTGHAAAQNQASGRVPSAMARALPK